MLPAARLLLPLALLAPALGCEWMERMKTPKDGLKQPVGPIESVSAQQLVGYLNAQAATVQSVRYPDVFIEVKAGKENYTLNESTLVCAKPRNFLLVGGRHIASNLVNIGSNDQEFWMYSRVPDRTYLYCSHADYPQAGRQLPVPFDPDWALQALGMTTYEPGLNYTVESDQRNGEHRLLFDSTTPQGQRVKREIVFAGHQTVGSQPQIKRHAILTPQNKVIATAEVREVSTVPVGRDPRTGVQNYAQVPTVVTLSWPQQEFRMDLKLRKPLVNELTEADRRGLFTRPTIDGANPINLADARFTPSSFRGAAPTDLPPRRR